MKKRLACLIASIWLLLGLMPLSADAQDQPIFYPDLSQLVQDEDRRIYMETMVGHHLHTDDAIRQTLQAGYSAVFFFDGGSDNMDDPVLSDLTYYRVSAVCLVLRMGEDGVPYLAYFNQFCSTLPDRPLSYGAWEIDGVGEVGPATICDGTYELFSVKHGGKYEALHLRTSREDDTIPAVYMTQERFCMSRADMINIHTRNVNHILENAMWSAGCVLIGDGDFGVFSELIETTYYAVYDTFSIGQRVGTVTIDRQLLKEPMYSLYESREAVDILLAASRYNLPQTYLLRCENPLMLDKGTRMWATEDTHLMSLPCGSGTDVRSVPVRQLAKGEAAEITGSIRNSAGSTWYLAELEGKSGYVYAGSVEKRNWLQQLLGGLFGF